MRENCTSSLSGGRRSAPRSLSAPPPTRYSEVGRAGYMGKRSAVVELFLGDMGSMQRELRPSTQREDQLTMETKLEQKAVNQLPKSVVREIRTPRSVGAEKTLGRRAERAVPPSRCGWQLFLGKR